MEEDTRTIEQKLDQRKDEMIAERQRKLEELLDAHDDLVRELFHLEKFVTLVSYDPKEAKQDQSEVFLQFKASYDLIAKIAVGNNPSGRTRKTRSGIHDRVSELVSPLKPKVITPTVSRPIASTSKTTLPPVSGKNRRNLSPESPLHNRKGGRSRKSFVDEELRRLPSMLRGRGGGRMSSRGVKRKITGTLAEIEASSTRSPSLSSPGPEDEGEGSDGEMKFVASIMALKEEEVVQPPTKKRKIGRTLGARKSERTLRARPSLDIGPSTPVPASISTKGKGKAKAKALPPTPVRGRGRGTPSRSRGRGRGRGGSSKGKGREISTDQVSLFDSEVESILPEDEISLAPDSDDDEEEKEALNDYLFNFDNLPPLPENFPRILHLYQRPPRSLSYTFTTPEQRPLQHYLPPKPVTMRFKPGQKAKPQLPSHLQLQAGGSGSWPGSGTSTPGGGVEWRRKLKLGPVVPPYYFRPQEVLKSYVALDLKPPPAQSTVSGSGSTSNLPNVKKKELNNFLSSAGTGSVEETIAELERKAEQEAIIREKIRTFQIQGRLPKDLSILLRQAGGPGGLVKSMKIPPKEPDPFITPWSETIKEFLSTSSTSASGGSGSGNQQAVNRVKELSANRVSVTRKIAKAIGSHFAVAKMNEERRAREEGKRVKILARNIGRAVEAEWRKAVWHIKQKFTEHERREEERLGRMALDQVLEQSGVLLGVQRGDMERARVGVDSDDESEAVNEDDQEDEGGEGDENAEEVEGDEEDGEEEEEEEEEEDDDDVEGVEEEEEVYGSHLLLGDLDQTSQTPVEAPDKENEIQQRDEGEESMDLESDEPVYQVPELTKTLSEAVVNDWEDQEDDLRVEEHLSGDPPVGIQSQTSDGEADTPRSPAEGSKSQDEAHLNGHSNGILLNARGMDVESPADDGMSLGPELQSLTTEANGIKEVRPIKESKGVKTPNVRFALDDVDRASRASSPADSPAVPEISIIPTTQDVQETNDDPDNHADFEEVEKDDVPVGEEDTNTPAESTPAELATQDSTAEPETPRPDVPAEGQDGQGKEDEPREEPFPEGRQVVDLKDGHDYEDLPPHLQCFAAAVVDYDPKTKIAPPVLLRGTLRPYQQSGLEWLATLHTNKLNGILADEMGLGKTIQTIALLAHLACDQGIWGPHLIVVPTSVILNWEMEFKKFLPGFRVMSYHGSTKRRKELRVGWNNRHAFNVCVTSYALASRDAHIFKRKPWYYFILDEAHMIKNFKSQRWNILLSFRSHRRLLLTGTPLQNNLTELWSLLRFLMSGSEFVELKEFGDWFSNPLEKAIENSSILDDETQERVNKLHTVLRPYILRRLKRDVEKELPNKYEHIVMCPLSRRQQYLYDEFMHRAHTREALNSGVYHQVANILMQLRKVCNHPDLFEVRPIRTSFAMTRPAVADFEIKDLLVRRRLLESQDSLGENNMDLLGLHFDIGRDVSSYAECRTSTLDATALLPDSGPWIGDIPPRDARSIQGYCRRQAYAKHIRSLEAESHQRYINGLRCQRKAVLSLELIRKVRSVVRRNHVPLSAINFNTADFFDIVPRFHRMILSYEQRAAKVDDIIRQFIFATPSVVAAGMPSLALRGAEHALSQHVGNHAQFDSVLHHASVRLQIAFPDPGLLQYDCGKLQELSRLLRERKSGGHRVLIFTQMTRILDILEIFLNFHGWLYLRLDGATKIEDRQYVTERFNADTRIFAFISSSRSGGVGVNLTGADTVVFFDSDFNPQMDRQCEDRAHRIGQIRDVHIYRFISQHTVEEAIFRKANQKRSLDDIVIQKGEFDWRNIFAEAVVEDEGLGIDLSKALGEFEEVEDAQAAELAAAEEALVVGEDRNDFEEGTSGMTRKERTRNQSRTASPPAQRDASVAEDIQNLGPSREEGEEGLAEAEAEMEDGGVADYMLKFVEMDWEFFSTWKV